jgi:hypothetical protein
MDVKRTLKTCFCFLIIWLTLLVTVFVPVVLFYSSRRPYLEAEDISAKTQACQCDSYEYGINDECQMLCEYARQHRGGNADDSADESESEFEDFVSAGVHEVSLV